MIQIEGLGKRYFLGSGSTDGTVRDWFAHKAASVLGRTGTATTRDFWALRNVSFEVEQGEAIGIIGKNGAGKSTLLKILSRITPPTEGYVRLTGRVASLLAVGTGFHPEMSGRENIYMNGAILGMKRAEISSRFDEIVDFAGVEKFLETPVKRYSSGMYVRLAFAVAAHLDPDILIVDEVLAVGDTQFRGKCLEKMNVASRDGRTVILVSHNIQSVLRLCSRAVLLDEGKKQSIGPTKKIVTEYLRDLQPPADSVVDLTPRNSDESAALTRIRFSGVDGAPKSGFQVGEPWRITLEFQVSRRLSAVIAGVRLNTIDEIPVASFWTKPQTCEAGAYRSCFQIDHCFESREFVISARLMSERRSIAYEERAASVSISPVADGDHPTQRGDILLSNESASIESIDAAPGSGFGSPLDPVIS